MNGRQELQLATYQRDTKELINEDKEVNLPRWIGQDAGCRRDI